MSSNQFGILLDLDEVDKFKARKFSRINYPMENLNDIKENSIASIAKVMREFGFPYIEFLDTYPGDTKIKVRLLSDTEDFEIQINIHVSPKFRKTNEAE